jgi:hypothetical protein
MKWKHGVSLPSYLSPKLRSWFRKKKIIILNVAKIPKTCRVIEQVCTDTKNSELYLYMNDNFISRSFQFIIL